jgi:hypothetical protein
MEHNKNTCAPMDDRARISIRLSIRMALRRLPWRLLKASERGARDRQETDYRLEVATTRVLEEIERGNYEIKLGAPAKPHSS